MSTITKQVQLHVHKAITLEPWESSDREFIISNFDHSKMEHLGGKYVVIDTQVLDVQFEDRDVTADAIDGLEKEAERIMEEARAKAQAVHERIANLRCLTHNADGDT